MTRHEKTGLMYTKYTYSHYIMYLHYCIRCTKSVSCFRFPMKNCINDGTFAGLPCVYMKLFNFEIQICDQILCVHKPYFLMPGHIYTWIKAEISHVRINRCLKFLGIYDYLIFHNKNDQSCRRNCTLYISKNTIKMYTYTYC